MLLKLKLIATILIYLIFTIYNLPCYFICLSSMSSKPFQLLAMLLASYFNL